MKLETKFSVGDVVYAAETATVVSRLECPDCAGAKAWHVTTPVGETFDIPCYTCTYEFGDYKKQTIVGRTRRLTIGQVRVEHPAGYRGNEYMCVETGIGSGSVFREAILFWDEASAQRTADEMAAGSQRAIDKRNEETREGQKSRAHRKPGTKS